MNASNAAPAAQGRILIVEDERQIARFLELELLHEGYEVAVAANGVEALIAVRERPPDLLVLDLMLPGVDGLEVCRRLRASGHPSRTTPIIMVTAKHSVPDRVAGLHTGADDYLTKPFSIEELLARIAALLRRSQAQRSDAAEAGWLELADLRVHIPTREVLRGGAPVALTAKEFDLLLYLLRHPRQVLSRDQIAEAVWGSYGAGDSNVIDVYVRYLRNKLGDRSQQLIQTVRGVGYVLRAGQELR